MMMFLFLMGTLLLLCTLMILHQRWIKKHAKLWLYRSVCFFDGVALLSLIIRFSSLFYRIEQSMLRTCILFFATASLFWLLFLSAAQCISFLYHHIYKKKVHIERTLLITLLSVLLVLISGYAQDKIIVEKTYDIHIQKPLQDNIRAVFISDLHIGSGCDQKTLAELFDKLRSHSIDAIFISGDLFDESTPTSYMKYFCEQSETLSLRDGIFYARGNHEVGSHLQTQFETMMKRHHIHVLRDEYIQVREQYYVMGRVDKKEHTRKTFAQIKKGMDPDKPLIVLDHRPVFDETANHEIDVQLSGHTHHGQIFPNTLLTKIPYPNDYGYYRTPYPMIVSSGLGTWGIPMRIGSYNEIVFVTLQGQQ